MEDNKVNSVQSYIQFDCKVPDNWKQDTGRGRVGGDLCQAGDDDENDEEDGNF